MSFRDERQRHEITIAFDGVSVSRGRRLLLDGASGMVHGGKVTAVVSACGARGDYHLLNVLAGHEESSGTVIANATPVSAPAFRDQSVLIDDDLTAIGRLTVRENLRFSYDMRVRDRAHGSVGASVESALQLLSLEDYEGCLLHTCSVSVKRRVSIARELMLHPAALFIDSAVEGLATHDAKELLEMLHTIADEFGCVVGVSMMQPRWALLELVDNVILIEGNRVVFSGATNSLLAAAEGEEGQRDAPEACINAVYRTATNPDEHLEQRLANLQQSQQAVADEVQAYLGQCAQGTLAPMAEADASHGRPFFGLQLLYLAKYGALQVRNAYWSYILSTCLLLAAAILIGLVYQSQDENGQAGMQNRIGIIFFLMSSTFLMNLLFVDVVKKVYVSFQRHRAHGYYGPATYLIYFIAVSMVQRLLGCFAFFLVVYALANVKSGFDLTDLDGLVFIVALTSFATSITVWLVCAVFRTTRIAHFVLFGIYTINTILAGIILNINTLPQVVQYLSFASFVRLGYESAVASQFAGRSFGCSVAAHPAATLAAATTAAPAGGPTALPTPVPLHDSSCFTGDSYMLFLGFRQDRKWPNMALLVYLSLGVIVLCYIAMRVGRVR
jgi:ABC-type multidrug transport system ATPase subunit